MVAIFSDSLPARRAKYKGMVKEKKKHTEIEERKFKNIIGILYKYAYIHVYITSI